MYLAEAEEYNILEHPVEVEGLEKGSLLRNPLVSHVFAGCIDSSVSVTLRHQEDAHNHGTI